MPLDLLPQDREMLLRYAGRPHRLPAHTKAKALLAAAQGMPEEQIALKHSIALHELAHLLIQYRSGGLAAIGLSGSGPSEGRSRRRARPELIVKTPGICGALIIDFPLRACLKMGLNYSDRERRAYRGRPSIPSPPEYSLPRRLAHP